MKRKITALCIVVAMLAVAVIGSTMAYFTDTDSAVNVMTMGNVDIEMYEKDRTGRDFSEYENTLQILPAVYAGNVPEFADDADIYWDGIKNAIDKTVTVENKGKSPAFVRTWLAFEVMDGVMHYNFGDTAAANAKLEWLGTSGWVASYTDRSELAVTVIDGISYYIARYTYLDELAAGETSKPSLIEFALDKTATNEDVTGIGDKYEILAFTQAIQSAGFSDAETALSEFGDAHPFGGMTVNHIANITDSNKTAVLAMSDAVTPADIAYGVNTALDAGVTSLVLNGDVNAERQKALSDAIDEAFAQTTPALSASEIVVVLNDVETIEDCLKNNENIAYCFDKTGIIVESDGTYALGNAAGIQTWGKDAGTSKKINAKLMADIVLPELNAGETRNWDPICVFNPENPSNFDGNGHTVYNLTIIDGKAELGMFTNSVLTIKNLNLDNTKIKSSGRSAMLAANHYGNIDNCHITGGELIDSYWAAGAISGLYNSGNITNCTVTGVTVKSNGGTGGIVGAINETGGTRSFVNCKVYDSTIENSGIYGSPYEGGSICGMVNISNSTVDFTGCEVVNVSPAGLPICGYADSDINVILP